MIEPLEIRRYVLGDLGTNSYLVWCPRTFEALVIDPADSGDFISQTILDQQVTLMGIVLTHGHFDHCLGLLELKLNFQVPVFMHEADIPLMKTAADSAKHWLKHDVDPVPLADTFVHDGDAIAIGDHSLVVTHTPGHTPGSICLSDDQVVFTGDTLFADSVGSTNHRYSSARDLHKSLAKIRELEKGKTVYPGHGDIFSL